MAYRDPIVQATGHMPFAGKHIAKYLFEKGREAGKNGNFIAKLGGAASLGVFSALHAVQLKMGITELAHHGTQNAAEVGVDMAYTVANGMVVYTQTVLAGLTLFTRERAAEPVPEFVATASSYMEAPPPGTW